MPVINEGKNQMAIRFVIGDITDHEFIGSIVHKHQIEQIYHTAAHAVVKTAFKNPYVVFNTNAMGFVSVLDAARQYDVKKVCFIQTDKFYGERTNAVETDQPQSSEPYATSKIAQTLAAETFRKSYGLKIKEVRSCNVLGYDLNDRLVPNVIRQCMSNMDPKVWYDDRTTRQYIHAEDVVDAMLFSNNVDAPDVYNICLPGEYTQHDIIMKILKHFPERTTQLEKMPEYFQVQNQSMVMQKDLGWQPKIDIDEAIKMTVEAFKAWKW